MNQNVKLLNFEYTYTEKFSFNINGIQIIENDDTIEIYNDVFRTIPLFITKTKNNQIIIFSNFNDYYLINECNQKIDIVGFWEIILLNIALGERTLYQDVKQMPSASKIQINKKDNTYKISRYWDFNIPINNSIKSINAAREGLEKVLTNSFKDLSKNNSYITGISGGMDSRITLAFLSKILNKRNLELFTYGFDERIFEYKYAKKTAKKLSFNEPIFHKLTFNTYSDSANDISKFTGGQISMQHSPLFSFLKTLKETNKNTLITTSYSEIIFSLKTEKYKENTDISFETIINNTNFLETNIKNKILKDIDEIKKNYIKSSSFTNINEFLYLTEQHPKFHEYLSYLFKDKINIFNPYTNYKVLEYVLSIPPEYRFKKLLQDEILSNTFNLKMDNVSSSRFEWGEIGGRLNWYKFKFVNYSNAILRILTKGHLQIFNPYQTEEQSKLLYKYFNNNLKEALTIYKENKLIDDKIFNYFIKLPLSTKGLNERYNLISLKNVLGK